MRSICLAALIGNIAMGQTQIDLKTQARRVDFGSAISTKPLKTGTTLPAICVVGEMYFKTDAAVGQNLYGCTAADTWTAQAWNPGACSFDAANNTLRCTDGSGNTYAAVKTAAGPTANQWVDYISAAGVAHTSQPTAAAVGAVSDPGANGIPYRSAPGAASAANATQMSGPFFCTDAGTTNAYACDLAPTIAGYAAGATYWFRANTANTGAATINLNWLGAKTIKKLSNLDLADGDIRAGQWVIVTYDGANMQMQSQVGNPPPSPAGVGTTLPGTCTAGDLFLKTDAPAGQTMYGCTQSNTWIPQGGPASLTFTADGTLVATQPAMNYVTGPGLISVLSDTGSQVDVQLGLDTAVVATKADVQSSSSVTCASLSASDHDYTCSMSPVLTQYTHNMVVQWIPDQTCAGGYTTLNVDELGLKPVYQSDGVTNPAGGGCRSGVMYLLRYDSSIGIGAWRMVQGPLATVGWSFALDATTAGIKGYVQVPYACTITNTTALSTVAGTAVVTLKKSDYAGFPATSAICTATCPAITSSQKSSDSALSGWTTTISPGDIIEYNVTVSDAAVNNLTVSLGCQR